MALFDQRWQRGYWIVKILEFSCLLALFSTVFIWRSDFPTTFPDAIRWLAGLVLSAIEFLIYLALFLSLKFNFFRWLQTIRLLGFPSPQTRRTLRRISALREHSYSNPWTHFFVIAGVLSALFYITDLRLFFAILIIAVEQQIIEQFRQIVPPAVLLLTTSEGDTVKLHAKINFTIRRLRTVAFLKVTHSYSKIETTFARMDCFRTKSDDDWEEAVGEILYIAPIIVLDARTTSPAVTVEAERTLVPGIAHRLILLVGEHGERPLLEHPDLVKLNLATEGIPVVREAGLLAMLHFLTRERNRLPTPERSLRSILQASGEWQFIQRDEWRHR